MPSYEVESLARLSLRRCGRRITSRCNGPARQNGLCNSLMWPAPGRPLNVGPLCVSCGPSQTGRGTRRRGIATVSGGADRRTPIARPGCHAATVGRARCAASQVIADIIRGRIHAPAGGAMNTTSKNVVLRKRSTAAETETHNTTRRCSGDLPPVWWARRTAGGTTSACATASVYVVGSSSPPRRATRGGRGPQSGEGLRRASRRGGAPATQGSFRLIWDVRSPRARGNGTPPTIERQPL